MILFKIPPENYRIEHQKIWRKYLQMTEKPEKARILLPENLEIRRIKQPTLSFYKFLYAATGLDLDWIDRLLMPDSELLAQISDEAVYIFVFFENNCPAGFIELDFRVEAEVELKYFGLMPEFRNRKWGRTLLKWAIQQAWQPENVRRMHFSTCELDDTRALPFYLNEGFSIFEETQEWQRILRPIK
jgi:GNAT superfamily N-acetyltransferase